MYITSSYPTLAAIILLSLASCGSPPKQNDDQQLNRALEEMRLAKNEEKLKQISAISYPVCEEVWTNARLSKCGEAVFRTSISSCRNIVERNLPSSAMRLDSYAGESWRVKSGDAALQSIEERVENLRRGVNGPLYQEAFAYASGDGTSDVEHIYCSFGDNMQLVSAS